MNRIDPMSKKADILLIISTFAPQLISDSEECTKVKIISDHGEELWVIIEDEFSIFFGDWHAHYSPNIEEYDRFIADLTGILENRKYTVCGYRNGSWCGSALSENEVIDRDEIIEDFGENKTIKCNFWDSSKNVTIDP